MEVVIIVIMPKLFITVDDIHGGAAVKRLTRGAPALGWRGEVAVAGYDIGNDIVRFLPRQRLRRKGADFAFPHCVPDGVPIPH